MAAELTVTGALTTETEWGIPRRRVVLWASTVMAITVYWGLQALLPHDTPAFRLSASFDPVRTLGVFFLALFCEFIDSSLGMGYGTTLTPLLLLLGFEPLEIVPAILMSECATGLTACVWHHRDGNINFFTNPRARQTALLLSALSAVGAVTAVVVAVRIPKAWLSGMIATIILAVGVLILATSHRRLSYRRGHIMAVGALAAFNKGLSGGGYGPLVTGGQIVSGLSPKEAIAITSLAEGITCFIGLTAYLVSCGSPSWALAIPLIMGALLSVPMATLTVRRFPETLIRRSVGLVTSLLGALTFLNLIY